MKKCCLTDEDRAKILLEYGNLGKKPLWTELSRRTGFNHETIRSFIESYNQTGKLSQKRGRPKTILQEEVDGIIGATEAHCQTTLHELSNDFSHAKSTVRKILNDDQIFHFQKTPECLLDNDHKQMRFNFCNRFSQIPYQNMPCIIFTDESSVCINPGRMGVWRHRGFHPEESTFQTTQKMLTLMVWGAIGPKGYRTPLIKMNGNINAEKYVRTLAVSGTIKFIQEQFGRSYIWMQDNAPSHVARLTKETLLNFVPQVLDWPPRSPDLNPIEHLWDYLKDRLGNDVFQTEDELFHRLFTEWQNIPNDIVHDCYSSFLARCIVCSRHNGSSLNTLWKEVKIEHDKYRTKLIKTTITTPIGHKTIFIEQ